MSHYLILTIKDLPRGESFASLNLGIYSTWKNIKSTYRNDKFKILAPR